jgi:thiosulfate dehydrogenase [quinone] large subunit
MSAQMSRIYQLGTIGVCVIAGLWTLLHIAWVLRFHPGDDLWGPALVALFVLALVLAFLRYARDRSALIMSAPVEEYPEPAIARFFFATPGATALWFVVRMNVGAQWLLAGWEKVQSPEWGTNATTLKGFVAGALAESTGVHPEVQGWYASFLQNVVLPNASFFSLLISWGEVAVGLGVLLGALTGIAAGFGVLMNFNYLLAGTVSINPILGMFGLFLVLAWRVAGLIGLDAWLLPLLGLPWKPGQVFREGWNIRELLQRS